MRVNLKNKVVDFGGNGLQFESNGENRPKVQDIEDGDFSLSNLKLGTVGIHKDDIDDLIILLQEVKYHGYKIDY